MQKLWKVCFDSIFGKEKKETKLFVFNRKYIVSILFLSCWLLDNSRGAKYEVGSSRHGNFHQTRKNSSESYKERK